jgi:DHA2 family multidrug resistance protein-like MFS transporter
MTQPERAGRKEWVGLAVLALPCLLYSMDLTVLNLAVPQLSADLRPTSAELLWIVDIYGFVLAGALLPMGTLGDRIGRRRLLLVGAAAFGLASLLAAFSRTVEMLVVARALLGLAAATLAPSTLSLIRNMFLDPAQRTLAIGVWIASFSAGGAIGPVFGGVLLEWFWWGSVFLLSVPVMLLLLIVGPALLPEFRDPDAGRPDVLSAALSLSAVLAFIYGIKRLAEQDVGWLAALSIGAGLALGTHFLRRQRALADPFIDLGLFRRPAFSAALGINVFGFFIAFGSFLLIAQYFQLVIGLSPLAAGLWSAPSGIAFVAGSTLTPLVVRRAPPAGVMTGGLLVASLGFGLLARAGGSHDLAIVVSAYAILSLGLAPVFTLTTDLIVGAAPPQEAGAAAGIAETSSELGGALGIALLGSLVTAIYRGVMEGGVPSTVPLDAAQGARETLGGALSVAEGLPAPLGANLARIAQDAYVEAFQASALICALFALTAAVATGVLLRRSHPSPAPEARPLTP